MGRRRKSADSTSVVQKAKIQAEKDEVQRRNNYETAYDALKQIRNPNKNVSENIDQSKREDIRTYLQAPASNEVNLRRAARYLYYRSQIFFKLINWYADMWCLQCRKVVPQYSFSKKNNQNTILKSYENTLNKLDNYNIQNNMHDVLVRCYLEDVCYSIFYRDDTGGFFYILEPEECRIDSRYMTSDFGFSMDMSKWQKADRQEIIEYLGEPIKSMYDEYKRTGVKYIKMPDEYAACFKFRSETPSLLIPPFATLLQELAGLNDLEDIQAILDKQSIYKLIIYPLNVLGNARKADDFEVTPDLAVEYYNTFIDSALPDYVSSAIVPGRGLQVIDFSESAADKDIDRVEQSQNQILSTAGGGAVLNSNKITSTAAFNAWLKSESEFAISSLMPQIQGFTNRMLAYDVSKPCKVEYFPITVYTKEEFRKSMLESCQYGYSNKIAYNTLLDINEKTTISLNFLEETILKLHDVMKYPLTSSFTTSNKVGAPTKDDSDLSPSGDADRNR